MPKKVAPRQEDLIRLMRLLADVATLKSDPGLQRQSLVDGLQSLFKTKLGWLMVADDWRPGRRVVMIHQILTSDLLPTWLKYIGDFTVNHPVEDDVYANSSIQSSESVQVLERYKLLATAAARKRYAASIELMKAMKLGDGAVAAYRTGPDGDRLVGFSLHRDKSAPMFDRADFALIRVAIEELRELEKRGHMVFRLPLKTDLSPRLQQVLERLLKGKSPKEIALELNLSVHTVREHMERLYQHFQVSSRGKI